MAEESTRAWLVRVNGEIKGRVEADCAWKATLEAGHMGWLPDGAYEMHVMPETPGPTLDQQQVPSQGPPKLTGRHRILLSLKPFGNVIPQSESLPGSVTLVGKAPWTPDGHEFYVDCLLDMST